MEEKKDYKILLVAILILLLTGGTFLFFNKKSRQAEPIVVDNSPKQEEEEVEPYEMKEGMSPISGVECENWNRRPFAIMYSGDMDARRNFRSLSQADFVLEMDHRATHSQPRVMGVYQCATPTAMGPMRSGRVDHINVAASLDAIFVPWGGSSVAKNVLKNHWVEHIDCNGEVAPSGSGTPACRKDASLLVAPLHSAGPAFSNLAELVKIAQANNYRLTSESKGFHHQGDLPRSQRPSYGLVKVKQIYPYRAIYKYDPEENNYKRFLQKKEGAILKPDIDQATKKQYAPKNIITIITKKEAWRTGIDYKAQGVRDPWVGIDEQHRKNDDGAYPNFQLGDPWFDTKFEGPARFFINGQDIKGVWKKKKAVNEPFRFYDDKGEPIKFVPGQIWMHVLGHDKHVSYDDQPSN
jgi:hypothetical protein